MEVKNGIIIDGVLHEAVNYPNDYECKICSLCRECNELENRCDEWICRLIDCRYFVAQNYNTDVYSISAPTQFIAQKWLRETKNLHIEIYRSAVGYGYAIVKADNGTWQEDDDSRGPNDGGLWDTYEEAFGGRN